MRVARKTSNIRTTVTAFLGNTIGSVPIYHDAPYSDPDGAGVATPKTLWIESHWVGGLAGSGGNSLIQFDVYSRVSSDLFGNVIEDATDALVGAIEVVDGCLTVNDYTTPTSPVATDDKLLLWGSWGGGGSPETRFRHDDYEAEFRRVTVTYYVMLVADSGGQDAYRSQK